MNAIQLEQVGKKYWLRHRVPDRRLMEVLHDAGRACWQTLTTGRRMNRASTGREFWALKDVSLEIKAGEVVGLIGRNGAGKSTLLKLISWIMAPTTGRVGVRGRMGCLLEVGSGFHPELTGRENVFLNGTILGMSLKEIRQKFDEIVAFSEVDSFLETPVKYYSSGMFVRLAFAVAALLDPEVLILDEVLSVGDAGFQKKSLAAIQKAVRNGTTCLMVSHHLPSVANLCQRAVLLKEGQIVADSTPEDVIREYLQTVRREGGVIAWPDRNTAPGNDEVRLARIAVHQSPAEHALADVEIGEAIRIEVDYDRMQPGEVLTGRLYLLERSGNVVLMSSSARPLSARAAEPPVMQGIGRHRLTCTIPAHLLNEGRYSVTIHLGPSINQTFAFAEDCVAFDVHDTGEQRGLYAGAWPGVVRPKLEWRTTANE